jgi:dTDP-4-dehydrorhamnose reductase
MKIALLGANGQLGRDLQRALEDHDVKPLTRNQLDVMDHERVRSVLMDLRPEVVLNTTAYHRVDDCETQAAQAYSVNALAVLNLARLANELDAVRVHVSTDYVFDGKVREPYTEKSAAFPLSVYGNSKLAGEYLVRAFAKKYFLIRTGGLYGVAGSQGKGGNFVETRLAKANVMGDLPGVFGKKTLCHYFIRQLSVNFRCAGMQSLIAGYVCMVQVRKTPLDWQWYCASHTIHGDHGRAEGWCWTGGSMKWVTAPEQAGNV